MFAANVSAFSMRVLCSIASRLSPPGHHQRALKRQYHRQGVISAPHTPCHRTHRIHHPFTLPMPPPPHSRRHQDTWFLRFISATNQLFVVTTDLASFSRISEIELLSGGGMLLRSNQSAVVRRTVHSLHFCDTLLMCLRLSRITLRQRALGMAVA